MKKPSAEEIQRFVKDDVFKWFMEVLAKEVNRIDTVRNINPERDDTLSRRMTIEIIENVLSEVYDSGELEKIQKKMAGEEESIVNKMENLKTDY